jgi:hypothetical protein
MVAGNGSAMVYAQPTDSRRERWAIEKLRSPAAFGVRRDLVAELIREAAVGLVAAEMGGRSIQVESDAGAARLWSAGRSIGYEPLTGDPLGVGERRVAGHREWLETTFFDPFPDAAFHLLDQFRSRRTGDLVVVAREGFDFRGRVEIPEHRFGHGSLTQVHMQTPLWSSQELPTVRLRTIDLFPSMLTWLGIPVPLGLDGELVWQPQATTTRSLMVVPAPLDALVEPR